MASIDNATPVIKKIRTYTECYIILFFDMSKDNREVIYGGGPHRNTEGYILMCEEAVVAENLVAEILARMNRIP